MKLVPKTPGAERELLFVELGKARNVVPLIDSGETADSWVLVMPLAERSLAQEIAVNGPMAVDAALGVLRNIAVALTDIEALVVHRDLKPANILLLEGVWCLADFGISRYVDSSTASDTRKFALSPPYAAPERWRAEHAMSATDVYSLGVVAYELLTGTLPFPGPSINEFRDQHLHTPPPRITTAPARLRSVVEECLHKAPGARPTAQHLVSRLETASASPRLVGGSRLADAYEADAERAAEEGRMASRAHTEEERRASLAEASMASLRSISEELLKLVVQEAPSARAQGSPSDGWSVSLGNARLAVSKAKRFDGRPWGSQAPPVVDVIGFASISVTFPTNRYGYGGRSHSLYYCNASQEGVYGWFETAFMVNAFMGGVDRRQAPFAMSPGREAGGALSRGIGGYQVAWPFTKLVPGEVDEFFDRWLGWFGAAAQDQLGHPSHMPERSPQDSWRQS